MYPIFVFFVFYFLFQVLRRTVCDGESQSALLLGGTGSGKSLLLDRVLRSLAHEAADRGASPLTPPPPPFRVVYLNGLAQTDDAVAMKEVVQQLGVTGTQGAAYSR
ncbi:unnamed protein product [Laminaria digitata]